MSTNSKTQMGHATCIPLIILIFKNMSVLLTETNLERIKKNIGSDVITVLVVSVPSYGQMKFI